MSGCHVYFSSHRVTNRASSFPLLKERGTLQIHIQTSSDVTYRMNIDGLKCSNGKLMINSLNSLDVTYIRLLIYILSSRSNVYQIVVVVVFYYCFFFFNFFIFFLFGFSKSSIACFSRFVVDSGF